LANVDESKMKIPFTLWAMLVSVSAHADRSQMVDPDFDGDPCSTGCILFAISVAAVVLLVVYVCDRKE